jgi:hypothetical protein
VFTIVLRALKVEERQVLVSSTSFSTATSSSRNSFPSSGDRVFFAFTG